MKKAVIFDLDGTLADTLESLQYCSNYAIGTCGFPEIPLEKYKLFVGDGAVTQIKRCLAYSGDIEGEFFEKAFFHYQMFFKEHCMHNVKPYEGIVEMLDELKKSGIKIAVFSNKPHERTVDVIESLFGKGYFDEILGQTDDRPKKPRPDGVFYLAEKMGVSLDEIAYVGDTNTDMTTGKSAGVWTIGVLWGFRDREELEKFHADVIIEKPVDILAQVL
jgi:phosphoglycolate phosphatase